MDEDGEGEESPDEGLWTSAEEQQKGKEREREKDFELVIQFDQLLIFDKIANVNAHVCVCVCEVQIRAKAILFIVNEQMSTLPSNDFLFWAPWGPLSPLAFFLLAALS